MKKEGMMGRKHEGGMSGRMKEGMSGGMKKEGMSEQRSGVCRARVCQAE